MKRETTWREALADLTAALVAGCGFSLGLVALMSMLTATWGQTLLAALVGGIVCFALFYHRVVRVISLAIIAILLGAGAWLMREQLPQIGAWLSAFGDFMWRYNLGQIPPQMAYELPATLCLWAAGSLAGFLLAGLAGAFYPAAALGAVLVGALIATDRGAVALPVTALLLIACLMIYPRGYARRLHRQGLAVKRGGMQLIALAMAGLMAALSVLILPTDTAGWYSPRLRMSVDDVTDAYLGATGGARARTLFSLSQTGFSPLGDRLGGPVSLSGQPVLEVASDRPLLLKGAVRDTYTGSRWTNSLTASQYRFGSPLFGGQQRAVFDLDQPDEGRTAGGLENGFYADLTVRITPKQTRDMTLFTAGRPSSLSPDDLRRITPYFDLDSQAFSLDPVPGGAAYTLRTRVLTADSGAFDSHVFSLEQLAEAYGVGSDRKVDDRYLQLPRAAAEGVSAYLEPLLTGEQTAYGKVVAIRQFLRERYTYTLTPEVPPEDEDFVCYFLRSGEGYCTYFASAMTVMARAAGVPARYVEGYRCGASAASTYTVCERDAHAWCEVYIDQIGWIPVDATPSAQSQRPDRSDSDLPAPTPSQTPETAATPEPTPDAAGTVRAGGAAPLLLALLGVLLALSAAVGLSFAGHRWRYSPARLARRLPDPATRADVYFTDILRMLMIYGQPVYEGETLRAYAKRMDQWFYNPEGTLTWAAGLMEALRYGGYPPDAPQLSRLAAFHSQMDRQLLRQFGPVKYLFQRVWFPPRIQYVPRPRELGERER